MCVCVFVPLNPPPRHNSHRRFLCTLGNKSSFPQPDTIAWRNHLWVVRRWRHTILPQPSVSPSSLCFSTVQTPDALVILWFSLIPLFLHSSNSMCFSYFVTGWGNERLVEILLTDICSFLLHMLILIYSQTLCESTVVTAWVVVGEGRLSKEFVYLIGVSGLGLFVFLWYEPSQTIGCHKIARVMLRLNHSTHATYLLVPFLLIKMTRASWIQPKQKMIA